MANKTNKTRWILAGIGVVLLLIWAVSHFSHSASGGAAKGGEGRAGQKGNKAVPVSVTTVQQQDMPIELEAMGHVESVGAINIRPQVSGILLKVLFTEGSVVQKGQPLFQLDPQPYQQALNQAMAQVRKDQAMVDQARALVLSDQAQVRSAQATVTRDQAQLALARTQEGRYAELLSKDFVSKDQVDQARTTRLSAEATLQNDKAVVSRYQAQVQSDQAGIANAQAVMQADQAAAQTARINLGYARIVSPMTGKTGSLSTHTGDVVTANTTSMVNITQLQPVFITFSVPEQALAQIQQAHQQGLAKVLAQLPAPSAGSQGTSSTNVVNQTETGTLSFLDNTVDPATGTLRLRGTFGNSQKRLWAGQFVTLRLVLGDSPDALTLPVTAVLTGQKGKYVFVPHQNKAVYRSVETGNTVGDRVIIRSGLTAGEKVISDGQAQLAPDMSISVKRDL